MDEIVYVCRLQQIEAGLYTLLQGGTKSGMWLAVLGDPDNLLQTAVPGSFVLQNNDGLLFTVGNYAALGTDNMNCKNALR